MPCCTIGDAGGVSAALAAAVEDVGGGSVEGEVGPDGAVVVSGDGNGAVDGKIEGLAVDGAGGGGGESGGGELVVVELDEAVDGVGVAHHHEHDGVALVDGDLVDVGDDEAVGGAGGVVDDAELADGLLGGVDVGEAGGTAREVDLAGNLPPVAEADSLL